MPLDQALLRSVPGWLTAREAELLYRLARRCTGRGVILEIGSWKGKSAICLAQGSRDGAGVPVVAVDPFTGSSEHGPVYTFPEFQANVTRAGIADLVTPMRKTSAEAARGWDRPIELLWIDGAHEEEFVRLDIDCWSPHLVPGGIIAFHDSTHPGVRRVLDERIFGGREFGRIRFIHGITYAVKQPPFVLGNRCMRLARDAKYWVWRQKENVLRRLGIKKGSKNAHS